MITISFYNQIKKFSLISLLLFAVSCKTNQVMNEADIYSLDSPSIKIVQAEIMEIAPSDSYAVARIQGKKIVIMSNPSLPSTTNLKATKLIKGNSYIMGIYGPVRMWWHDFYNPFDPWIKQSKKDVELMKMEWFYCINLDKALIYPVTEEIIDGVDYNSFNVLK